jgi:hypothetical protein
MKCIPNWDGYVLRVPTRLAEKNIVSWLGKYVGARNK